MTEKVDLWMLIAGLGVFLFGMYMLEDSLKRLSGRTFRRWIKAGTGTLTKSILTGAGTTAVVQSSSAISLMVLALVGAGVLAMENAVGVILGSNLGTTFTTWLVALLGFKVEIQRFAFPFIGLGGLGIIFLKNSPVYSNVSRFLVGFGFIFLGIDYMKTAVETLSAGWQTSVTGNSPLLLFFAAGLVVSAITQSSSATLAMALTSVHTGLISFEQAALVVIGANVGTTVTVYIGSLGGEIIKKQVALSHIVFNFVTALVAILLLKPFAWVINDLLELDDNPEISIAAFHTLFNLSGILLFAPFISRLTRLVRWAYPEKKTELALFVNHAAPAISDAAVEATRREIQRLAVNVAILQMDVLRLDHKLIAGVHSENIPHKSATELYDKIKLLHGEISAFASRALTTDINLTEANALNHFLYLGRGLLQAAKQSKDVRHYLDGLDTEENPWAEAWQNDIRKSSLQLFTHAFELLREKLPSPDDFNELMGRIAAHDEKSVQNTIAAVGQGVTGKAEISNILMTIRLVHQSQHAILESFREVCPSEKQ